MPNKRQLSPSLSSKSPVKKKPANLLKLLESRATNTKFRKNALMYCYYNYKFTHSKLYKTNKHEHISHIFEYNPDVELHKFSIDNTKINITKYNQLDYNRIVQYAQTDSPYSNQLNQFYVSGVNIKDDNTEDFLLTAESLKYLYCNEDFSTLYLFYPNYKELDDNGDQIGNDKEGKRTLEEFLQNQNIELIKDTKQLFKNLRQKVKESNNYYASSQSSSENDTRSESIGGSKSLDKQKYMKRLKKYTLEKLLNVAKNKKIKCTKKVNGKIVNINTETIIKKLCKQKYG
jgi:hypothetical protein